jgi:dihydroflavonol-4-reductase
VHVDDVAAGHLAALRRGAIGERYILGGQNVSLRIMLAEIAQMIGHRPPRLRLPVAAVYPIAVGAELWSHVSRREPFVTRDGLRMARHNMFFQDAKARRDLAYLSRPYQEGIADAIAWFRNVGYLDDKRSLVKNQNSRPTPSRADVSAR